jgi:hypothetical protein
MSQTTAFKIAAGLSAGLGLAWSSATVRAVAVTPQDMAPPVAAATAPVAPAEPQPARVLLLSDGRVIQGAILETDDGYVVKTGFGPLTFKRRDVVRAFPGVAELYAYKREVVPENDPDERLKLAQWCVGQKMYAEAQNELQLVLAYSPGLKQAEQMQHMLKARLEVPTDGAVMLSSASADQVDANRPAAPGAADAEPPAPLSANVLRELRDEYRKNPRSGDLPVILDLAPQEAVQRYREFATFIHPSLQRYCAGCHNEQSDSSFRLIQTRVRRDMDNELVIRANLDAVLPLVDSAQPEASKLLTSSIMPHPPNNRAVLSGPNSRTYQQFAAWVQGMTAANPATASGRSPARASAPLPPGYAATPGGAAGGGFAADRSGATPPPASASTTGVRTGTAGNPPILRATPPIPFQQPRAEPEVIVPSAAGQILPDSTGGQSRVVPPDSDFQVQTAESVVKSMKQSAPPAVTSKPSAPTSADAAPDTSALAIDPAAVVSPQTAPATPAAPKKPIKIKGDVLQKFMTGRGSP